MAEKKSISINYEKHKDIQMSPVSGAWGGPSQDGSLVVEFFMEVPSIPNYVNMEVKDGKIIPNSEEIISRGDITRVITSISVMNPQVALSIGQWMVENAKKLGAKIN